MVDWGVETIAVSLEDTVSFILWLHGRVLETIIVSLSPGHHNFDTRSCLNKIIGYLS